ncbi:MAG: RNA pseudouridine synthase, partial [Pseudomonadota bacterium]
LDKETSGIMMLAHGRGAAAMFSTALAARQIHKTYLAVICNSPPKRASMIDQRLVHERKDGRIQHQPAQTRYQLLARAPSHKASIVLLQPVSGRKHQLRRHLQGLGCPIIGDRRYGSRQQEPFPVKRLALHAWRLELPDALLGAGETFTAQPDQAFLALVKQLIPGDELMEMLHRTT